jgi:hypothetical protein
LYLVSAPAAAKVSTARMVTTDVCFVLRDHFMGINGFLADHGCQHGAPVVLGALPTLPLEVAPMLSGVMPTPLGVLLMLLETLA